MSTKSDAQEAIYAGISRIAGIIEHVPANAQATIVRDLAVAYRLAAGGTQPGSGIVDKS
jgi:hypothetical protein